MSQFMIPRQVYTGKGALNEAAEAISKYGKKALIVTGKHVGKSSMMDALKSILDKENIDYRVFKEITGEPTDEMIAAGAAQYTEFKCDMLIGIGGGSSIDSAKAIAAVVASGKTIMEYASSDNDCIIPPLIAIPTTAGTGSEATKFTVITDIANNVKRLIKGDELIPAIAVIDYEYTMDMPRSITASTGMDALTHAIEAYTSRKANLLTDTYAVSAVKRIFKYLPVAYKNGYDADAREQMSLAAYEAGVCINNSSVTIVHGMSRPIGALFHVPHGMSNALLIKDCLAFAAEGAVERFARLSREAGIASYTDQNLIASNKLIEEIEKLVKTIEIPSMEAYGIDKDEYLSSINKMAADAVASGSPANTIREVSQEDCIEIYRKAY
ncbi:MAG: iron-containing alcohol dehydrogenase [Lachnospiraceae bacterium]|nr:iron-containing alcohol dehydrogenase [Lachnospiraceae bacterium]